MTPRHALIGTLTTLLCSGIAHAAEPHMPRGAYLRRPAPTAVSLVRQVKSDPVVRRRYEKAWGVAAPAVLSAFRGVRLTRMLQPRIMKVYYFRPATGLWGYRLRRVRSGTPIFVHADGTPFLVQVCGNPLLPAPKHPTPDPKHPTATRVSDFDPQESIAADLVPTVPQAPIDTTIAPAEPPVPSEEAGAGAEGGQTFAAGGGSGAGRSAGTGRVATARGGGSLSGGAGSVRGGGSSSAGARPSGGAATGTSGSAVSTDRQRAPNRTQDVASAFPTVTETGTLDAAANALPPANAANGAGSSDTTGGSTGGSIGGSGGGSLSSPEPSVALLLPLFLALAAWSRRAPVRKEEIG